jgi:hypothetical protein
MGSSLPTRIKAWFKQWKHPSSPSRSTKKSKVTPSAGKVMLTVFLDSQGVLLAHFQKRGENINSASHCKVLLKFWDAIRRNYLGQLIRGVLLHHDNARPRTARATQERIQELQWELLEHSHYIPDMAPSDFQLFGPLKKHLGGKCFIDDEELKRRCGSGWDNRQKTSMLRVSKHW